MRVVFDTREIYYLTQYMPVYRALRARGVECTFVAYKNRPTQQAAMEKAFATLGVPVRWFETRETGLVWYRSEPPDWILFGNGYGHLAELSEKTRTAMLYHGIGTKSDVYSPTLIQMDVRFIEGPHYVQRLRALYPEVNFEPVGYAKVDPLSWPERERPRLDLAALGLDPRKKTLLYAPTHMPSSFPRMSPDFPGDFADFNLLVKPHSLSFFGGKKKSHRQLMELWSRSSNVHVAPYDVWDPVPYMTAADLMISDESSILFEFAVLDRPIVWCDFLWVHWTRRGPLSYRLRRRLDPSVDPYRSMAAHAPKYRDLRRIVEQELADPGRYRAARAQAVQALIGPTDGRASERIADYLLRPATPKRPVERSAPARA